MIKINLFDFDETIYDGDSTVDFFKYIFKKKPISVIWLPVMGFYGFLHLLKDSSHNSSNWGLVIVIDKSSPPAK